MRVAIAFSFIFIVNLSFGSVQPKLQINQLKERTFWKNLVDGKLIAHSRFICIEKMNLTKEELSYYKLIEVDEKPTGIIDFYELNDAQQSKYQQLLGKSIYLTNPKFGSVGAKIDRLCLVNDLRGEEVYVAAEFSSKQKDFGLYYSYATIDSTHSEFTADLEEEGNFKSKLESETFYLAFDSIRNHQDTEYEETEVMNVKWGNRNFVVVQNRFVGVCASIISSQVAVYEKKAGGLKVISHFITDDYVYGMTDSDHDGVMEVILVSFTSTSIHELKSDSIKQIETLSWSFEGCPC